MQAHERNSPTVAQGDQFTARVVTEGKDGTPACYLPDGRVCFLSSGKPTQMRDWVRAIVTLSGSTFAQAEVLEIMPAPARPAITPLGRTLAYAAQVPEPRVKDEESDDESETAADLIKKIGKAKQLAAEDFEAELVSEEEAESLEDYASSLGIPDEQLQGSKADTFALILEHSKEYAKSRGLREEAKKASETYSRPLSPPVLHQAKRLIRLTPRSSGDLPEPLEGKRTAFVQSTVRGIKGNRHFAIGEEYKEKLKGLKGKDILVAVKHWPWSFRSYFNSASKTWKVHVPAAIDHNFERDTGYTFVMTEA